MRIVFNDAASADYWGNHFTEKPAVTIDGERRPGIIEADDAKGEVVVLIPESEFPTSLADYKPTVVKGKIKIKGKRLPKA